MQHAAKSQKSFQPPKVEIMEVFKNGGRDRSDQLQVSISQISDTDESLNLYHPNIDQLDKSPGFGLHAHDLTLDQNISKDYDTIISNEEFASRNMSKTIKPSMSQTLC
jgi:hypothetical protein